MARATRSSAHTDHLSKKRKRNSSAHEKPQKMARTGEWTGSVGESTLVEEDGRKILQVLEGTDTLGLLDRVYSLSPEADLSLSLRALLASPQQHPLRVLTAAVHNLRPLSSHLRSRPSETAAKQLSFCNLAHRLIDQASHNIPVSLNATSILSTDTTPDEPSSPSLQNRRYALVQHLPSGDYWSSLSSDPPAIFKDIPTGHAELVSILPASSSSQSSKPVPTLASYNPAKSYTKKLLPAQRRLTTGAFLDYGPCTSFAPSFDHDCQLVGRRELGEALWYKHERQAQRELELREWIEGRGSIMEVEEIQPKEASIDVETEFDGILPPEDVRNLKAALDNAELEKLVDELLTRNQRALIRLQELQIDRLTKQASTVTSVDESSEESEIAHGIMDSLETLTTLRPRAANGDIISVVPPTSVLRKLLNTLALEPHPGWHGTLVSTRATALRDDSTVKVRASSAVPAAVSTSSSPAPTSNTPVATAAAPTTTPYTGYTYAYQAQQQAQAYRPAATAVGTTTYTPYKPGATSYYQNYIQGAQQQQQYYGQQAYGVGATGQQPYAAYSSWFAHAQYSQAAAAATAAGTASTGRGTPQPATAAYGSYYQQPATQQRAGGATATAATATPGVTTTPAVANTVAMNKAGTGAATGAWVGYPGGQQGGVVPTLPAHLRTTTTGVVANGYQTQQQQSYYSAYPAQQTQQSTAR
ncbi:hypothetical protein P691DRAFT_754093 [Macrolepiota fuliginosa MF-IS2]|uniref:Uncharacterized protein n=1 Tax=Macrolepiota fuliginosa MF-IS2 TaxID=1400762 RepID=A0A9P5XNV4_9AGAR|nr:hypothetical protein P691DRAFT_754093 [Macrolepiota fuliginosa MF-IS2]